MVRVPARVDFEALPLINAKQRLSECGTTFSRLDTHCPAPRISHPRAPRKKNRRTEEPPDASGSDHYRAHSRPCGFGPADLACFSRGFCKSCLSAFHAGV